MKSARALELFSASADLVRQAAPVLAIYQSVQAALEELIGFKLLTVLRLEGQRLVRMHTSDLQTYPAGGSKDISADRWLQEMLAGGTPIITPDEETLRQRFFDHETIFSLGCGSVLNYPVTSPRGTLGSVNLLHRAGWYEPGHALLAAPFASLMAVLWLDS
jgi:hypothetical protein